MTEDSSQVRCSSPGGYVKINDSNVVAADIEGKNGVVHVIDKVLIP